MSFQRRLLTLLAAADDFLQSMLGILLLLVSLGLIWRTVVAIPAMFNGSSASMLIVIHDVMLIMIVLELLWTVLTYLREHSVPLEPFLFVGIISSVRKLLLIGAQMSLSANGEEIIALELKEILLHGFLVLILVISLVLVRWSRRWKPNDDIRVAKLS